MVLIFLAMAETGSVSAEESADEDPSGVQNVVSLSESALTESSGLAISHRRNNHFWSHNDSGAKALLYAFDSHGRETGKIRLNLASAVDWEDMASFTDQGVARLLVADCGDNNSNRPSITLYLFDEPDPEDPQDPDSVQTISVRYPDGSHDCEAVAVDEHRRQIVLITKSIFPACGVYVFPLPSRATESSRTSVIAKRTRDPTAANGHRDGHRSRNRRHLGRELLSSISFRWCEQRYPDGQTTWRITRAP